MSALIPSPEALKKKGHLYSLIVTPGKAMIKKHRDKADEASKDETLATASFSPVMKDWVQIELVAIGDTVKAKIGDTARLEASDPSFHVAKPAVVFRVVGGEAEFDDVQVSVSKP